MQVDYYILYWIAVWLIVDSVVLFVCILCWTIVSYIR